MSGNSKKCYHCEGDHYIGARTCPWYKYEEEIVDIQTKNKVSRGQAKLTMDSRNPNWRMNYAEIVKSDTAEFEKSERKGNRVTKSGELREMGRQARSKEDKERQQGQVGNIKTRAETEVVCMSPNTGSLFTTTVELGDIPVDAVDDMLPEDVLRETIEVFDELEGGVSTTQEQGNEDIGRYEEELRRAQMANKPAKRERRSEGERARSSSGEASDGRSRQHKR